MTDTITFQKLSAQDVTRATRILSDQNHHQLMVFPRETMQGGLDALGPIGLYKNGTFQCSATLQQYDALLATLAKAPFKKLSGGKTAYTVEEGLLTNLCPKKPKPELEL